ncbi:MAG: HD domain-containing protein [Planctomycetota bacterium]|jgi:exopolyphosphatase/guanosine-5'-triphosphate,3'-diphosphate pyrophosphatase|nr:HD domain-containing protein [Planctomycetota bacterium]
MASDRKEGKISGRHHRQKREGGLMGGIDIGSAAMRMIIAELDPGGEPRLMEELTHPISTGSDIFRHGRILPETLRSIMRILDNILCLAADYGTEVRRVVGSSSIREAANRDLLSDRVRIDAGLELSVLDTAEESRLVYQALLPWLHRRQGNYSLALSIGGGSTEMIILRGEDLQIGGVKLLGTSRLFHASGQSGGQDKAEILRAMAANIVKSTGDVYQEYSLSGFLLINRLLYRAFRNDPSADRHADDFVIPTDALRRRLELAYRLGSLDIGRLFNLGLADAELLIPAMVILDNFAEAVEVPEITFTNTDLLTGLIREMAMSLRGEDPLVTFHRQMVRAARAVGEKYGYDRAHARLVTEFSLVIFDALRDTLDLDGRDRLLLELSAVLHDIGMRISDDLHHRHSAYLIQWSDIVGLSEKDRELIAQTAYFHRMEIPSESHAGYMALSRADRIRVGKLAGILRLADVLDRGHRQNVKNVRAEIAGGELKLRLEASGGTAIVYEALPKKADLLELVSGLRVTLLRETR